MSNLVSIVIAAYNAEKYIAEAIESCLNQTYKDIEVIIVNDGSTDNTLAIIQKYVALDSRITLLDQANKGVGMARNTGNNAAKSDFIAVMDADDAMLPNRIEVEYQFMQENPDIDLISCWGHYINEHSKIIGNCINPTDLMSREDYDLYKKNDRGFMGILHPGVMYRKVAVLRVGGYRNMRPGQDIDLLNRMAEQGSRIIILPKILVKYRIYRSEFNTWGGAKLYTPQWLQENTNRRKKGITEISYEQYEQEMKKLPFLKQVNIKRKVYAKHYFKHAALHWGNKEYMGFIFNILKAGVLDWRMVTERIVKRLK
jgi:glycosyltransferase involved in cell wall biosynthesis